MNFNDEISKKMKHTQVKVYLKESSLAFVPYLYSNVLFGEWREIEPLLNKYQITDYRIEFMGVNSAFELLDFRNLDARIEPGAIIREQVTIANHAVILMGAVLNVGCFIGEKTMIDMGAIIGSCAIIEENCHIGANAVIAGVMEPYHKHPVRIEKNCLIGANAVILEGVTVHEGAIVGAGAVVTKDVEANCIVVGIPARVLKQVDEKIRDKNKIIEELR